MTDILLVNPLFLNQDPVERRLVTPYFPLGLLYLAAVARDAGYDVAVFDAMFETSDDAFRAALTQHQPHLVGIAALATVRAAALRLAGIAKAAGAIVVLGGADPTGRPEVYLRGNGHDRVVDVVVAGEGEQTFLDLLGRLKAAGWRAETPLDDLTGLALPDGNDGIRRTGEVRHTIDLDHLPYPLAIWWMSTAIRLPGAQPTAFLRCQSSPAAAVPTAAPGARRVSSAARTGCAAPRVSPRR